MLNIAVTYSDVNHEQAARNLALELDLSFIEKNTNNSEFDYLLNYSEKGLELIACKKRYKPLFIDFADPALQYRLTRAGKNSELLAKALGIKKSQPSKILDATAGLGQDSILMAALGCTVHLLERSPIIAALLADALERAKVANTNYASTMTFVVKNAIEFMQTQEHQYFDIVYLDPMYPDLRRSAAVKKEMQILRDIVGEDLDVGNLFEAALNFAQQRVVIKRPRLAPFLLDREPDICFKGVSSRFDVYLIKRK